MVAIVEIREKNNVGETPTVKTSGSIRFKDADNALVDLNNPLVKPPSGTVYSYEKWLRLYIGATGPIGAITTPRAYSDGITSFGTGIYMKAGRNGSYVQPVKTSSSYATIDFFSYTSGAPLSLDVTNLGPYTGSLHDIADYLVLQASINSTAGGGLSSNESLTCMYDET